MIVGAATLPAIGIAQKLHPSMGTGAVIPAGIEPPAFRKFLHSPYRALNGPKMVFVRLGAGVAPAQGLDDWPADDWPADDWPADDWLLTAPRTWDAI